MDVRRAWFPRRFRLTVAKCLWYLLLLRLHARHGCPLPHPSLSSMSIQSCNASKPNGQAKLSSETGSLQSADKSTCCGSCKPQVRLSSARKPQGVYSDVLLLNSLSLLNACAYGDGEVAPRLRAPDALAEDMSLFPGTTRCLVTIELYFQGFRHPLPVSMSARHTRDAQTHKQAKHTYIII